MRSAVLTERSSEPELNDAALGKPTRVRYQMLGLLCSLSMITYFDRVCFASAAAALAIDLGLQSKEQLKWAHTAFAIAYGAFELPAGWLGDKWGPKATLLRIVVWWSLFTMLTGVVGLYVNGIALGGLGTLVVVRFLFGAGEAGAYPNITRSLHNWFPPERWEMAQGYIWMSGRIAGGITPFLWAILVWGTSFSGPLVHWRGAFFVFGALGLIWCLIFAFRFRDRPAQHSAVNDAERALIGSSARPNSDGRIPFRAILTNRSLWALCSMYSLITYGWFFNITYFPGYLRERFQLPAGDLWGAIFTGAPLWVGAIGCITGGYLVNFVGHYTTNRGLARQVVGCLAMSVAALSWLGVSQVNDLTTFCVLISLAAFCVDLTVGAAWATCQDLGQQHAGVVAAWMNTFGTIGAALAAFVTGAIVEHYMKGQPVNSPSGDPLNLSAAMNGYQAVFYTYAIVYVIAAICWFFISTNDKLNAPLEMRP